MGQINIINTPDGTYNLKIETMDQNIITLIESRELQVNMLKSILTLIDTETKAPYLKTPNIELFDEIASEIEGYKIIGYYWISPQNFS